MINASNHSDFFVERDWLPVASAEFDRHPPYVTILHADGSADGLIQDGSRNAAMQTAGITLVLFGSPKDCEQFLVL